MVKASLGLLTGLFVLAGFLVSTASPAKATAGINEQVNYQARLLTSTGAVVPDGTYNMEFKIYQDGNGCEGGGSSPCGGTLEWTETRTGTDKVTVKNGYFSVSLGSVTAFGTNVDWNQDTLWLSLNIGGTGSPSWDGEMLPFRRLAAAVYALNAKQLGGLDWSKFVQVAPTAVQTDTSTLSTLFLNKTGASGNIVQLQKNGSDVLTVANGGATTITTTTNSTSGLAVLNSSGASAINIDTASANLITNNSIETGTTGWTARGASTISQSTAQKYDNNNSLSVVTTAAANDGAKFAYSLAASTQYSFSVFVKASGSNFSTLQIGYAADGSTDTSCATAQDAVTTHWRRLTCTFTTGAVSGSPYVYVKQTDATARTFYVDAAKLETAAAPTLFRSGKTAISGSLMINAGQASASAGTNTLEITQEWGSDTGFVLRGSGENDLFANLMNVISYDNALSFFVINEVTKSSTFQGGSGFFGSAALRVFTTEAGAKALDVFGAAGQTTEIMRVLDSSSVTMMSVGATGQALFQNTTDSTTAFRVLTDGGTPLFVVDTTNSRAYIGDPTADAVGALLVLDTKNDAGDPTGVAGGMYYNSSTSKFRCYQAGAWTDCIGAGGSTTMQQAYDAGNTVTTTTARNVLFTMPDVATDPSFLVNLQCDTCSGSNGRFAVQDDGTDVFTINPGGGTASFINLEDSTIGFEILNGSGVPMFTVDNTNAQVEIGDQTADGTGALLILDTKNTAADPTGVNGGMYYNSSLAKFRCYENSQWKDCVGLDAENFRVSPFFYQDFLEFGSTGRLAFAPWQRALLASGTDSSTTGDATHIGVLRITSSTTTNSGEQITTQLATPATLLLAGMESFEFIFRVPTTTNTTIRAGFHDAVNSTNPVDGSFIEIAGTALNGEVANNSTITNGTGTTISANTWYRGKLVVNSAATATTFYLYNSSNTQLWTTTVTATHPTAAGREMGNGIVATNSGTTAVNILDLDYMAAWWDRTIVR